MKDSMGKIVLFGLVASLLTMPTFAAPFDEGAVTSIDKHGKTSIASDSKGTPDVSSFDSMKSLTQWLSRQKKGWFKKNNFDAVIAENIDLAQSFDDLIFLVAKTSDKNLKDRLVKMAAKKAATPREILAAAKQVATRSGAGALRNGLVLDWAKGQAKDVGDVVELVKYYRTILLEQRDEMDHKLLEVGVRYVKTQEDANQLLGLQKYAIRRASLINLLNSQVKTAGLKDIVLPQE
ncbi:MAG: hypothetical protein WA705_26385 [Candidatus Ozemobacteraceae bacterium]